MGMKATKRRNNAILFVILLLVSLVYIVPILMMVLGSFKDKGEVLAFNLALPTVWHFENYAHVIETGNILRAYVNSILVTTFTVIVTLVTGALTGVVIARNNDRCANGIYYFFLFGITATMQMVTTFYLLKTLNLYGTYFGVIMVFIAINLPFTVMTITSFVRGVPKEIDEAAIIDGCGPLRLIFQVLMPILKPIMTTNLIIVAIGTWNNFMVPLYFFNTSAKVTIPLTVYNFYGLYSRNWHYVFAAMVLTVLPVVILYLCLQKYIVGGMTSGAVKG